MSEKAIVTKKDLDALAYAERRSEAETSYDYIRKHYIDPEKNPLSECNARIHKRWKVVYTSYMNGFLKDEIIKVLQNDFNITSVQARNDIEKAMTLFGDVHKTDKKMTRHFVAESSRELYRMALASGDLKNANKSLEILIKAAGLDKPDEDGDILEKMKPIKVEMTLDPVAMAMLKQIASSGVVNFNDFMQKDSETIDYIEMDQEDDSTD